MKRAVIIGMVLLAAGCCGPKEASSPVGDTGSSSGKAGASAMVIVYRTKTDHRTQVPVGLSEDRGTIISYPHPKDLRTGDGEPPLPTDLGDGWLLDNRGIGANVAFLGMDYSEYAALDRAPSLPVLDSLIVDRDPLQELWECGPRSGYADLVGELSTLVRNNGFADRCKRLK